MFVSRVPVTCYRLSSAHILRHHLHPHVKRYTRLPSQPPNDHLPAFSARRYLQHTAFTLDFFRRFAKFTAIGLFAVGMTAWTAFESVHMYVEYSELKRETDPEIQKWEWDLEGDKWAQGESGGTDSALGLRGCHAVRAAWMSQNWGVGQEASVTSTLRSGKGNGGLNVVEARLETTLAFLEKALEYANENSDKLRPTTITDLLQQHASVLERMGTKGALHESRKEFNRLWARLPGQGIDAARIALKLGDLSQRLGDSEDALAWWARAIQLTQDKGARVPIDVPPVVPDSVPTSPLAQRTFISTLVSLSAFYATAGQLVQAQEVEERSLNLLRSIQQPESFDAAPPPHALHALYVLHRSALLSIHLAEVQYALRNKEPTSLQWLARAAQSSERVALALTGLPTIHPDAPMSKIPHPPSSETPLIPTYAKSLSMRKPARSLLRDARRTAAEAWNLMGLLTEASETPGAAKQALECYERAVGWAGIAGNKAGGIGKPGEGTLESEWKVLWSNYVRARNAVKEKGPD